MFLTTRAGTAVTVNFIADTSAGLTQIALDGLNITTVDTHNASAHDTRDCTPVSWSSGNLPSGHHTIALYPLTASIDVHNFMYVIGLYRTYPLLTFSQATQANQPAVPWLQPNQPRPFRVGVHRTYGTRFALFPSLLLPPWVWCRDSFPSPPSCSVLLISDTRSSVHRILSRQTQLSPSTVTLPLGVPWRPHRWGATQDFPTGLARCGNALSVP